MTDREAFEKWLSINHLFDTSEFIYNEEEKRKAKDENLLWVAWQKATEIATIAERERCAKIADEYKGRVNGIAENIAMKIRGE